MAEENPIQLTVFIPLSRTMLIQFYFTAARSSPKSHKEHGKPALAFKYMHNTKRFGSLVVYNTRDIHAIDSYSQTPSLIVPLSP